MFCLLKCLFQVKRIFSKARVCVYLMCVYTHIYVCVYMVKPCNGFNSVF